MARIDTFTIERTDPANVLLGWAGDVTKNIRIFKDGVLFQGPFLDADSSRSLSVPWTLDDPITWEIHEENDDGSFSSEVIFPDLRPNLQWKSVDDSIFYNIYHKEGSGGTEAKLQTVPPNTDTDIQEFQVQQALNGVGGVWHFFRVESVDEEFAESISQTFAVFVRDQPIKPSDIVVTGAAGVFTVTLTA